MSEFVIDDGRLMQYNGQGGHVVIPDGVTSIWGGVFKDNKTLTAITIPPSVTWMYECVFAGCDNLKEVHISDVGAWCNIHFATDPEHCGYWDCPTANPLVLAHKLYLNGAHVTELVIPEGVEKIAQYAFACCDAITAVTFPESLTEIGSEAFVECEALTAVTIPKHVTEVKWRAFGSCGQLSEICVHAENTAYCAIDGVLYTKDQRDLVQYPNGKKEREFVLPQSVTTILGDAFAHNKHLAKLTVHDGVTYIGWCAFFGCSKLTVHCGVGSTAAQFAKKNRVPFVAEE